MLTVFGSLTLDTIHAPGGTYTDRLGGSGLYAALSAGGFTRPALVGRGGKDVPVSEIDALRSVMEPYLSGMDGAAFRYEARYLDDRHTREDIRVDINMPDGYEPRIPDECRGSEFVCMSTEDPGQQVDALGQFDGPAFALCDTISYWVRNKRDMVKRAFGAADAAILNDMEAAELTGCNTMQQCARTILGWGAEHVIIKRGRRGSMLYCGGREFPLPAYPLDAVADPTGAGDAFAGAVVGYLCKAGSADLKSLRRACMYGNVMGSFAAERLGTAGLLAAGPGEVDGRMRRYVEMLGGG